MFIVLKRVSQLLVSILKRVSVFSSCDLKPFFMCLGLHLGACFVFLGPSTDGRKTDATDEPEDAPRSLQV